MKLEVLVSCMNQTDFSLAEKIGVKSDTLMVNQTDCCNYDELSKGGYKIRMLSTVERGLSKSRNMAIDNSMGDICLLCDDDELLENSYADTIINAFGRLPCADIIAFEVKNRKKKLPNKIIRIGYFRSLRISSSQIAYKRDSIKNNNLKFDINLGAGTDNGVGEENKFLHDCLRNKLKIYYYPVEIASVTQKKSTWFYGYNEKFFEDRGASTRYIYGLGMSIIYGLYYIAVKRKKYINDISTANAAIALFRGIILNRISHN